MFHAVLARFPLIVILLLFPVLAMAILGRTRRLNTAITIPLFALLNVGLTFSLFVTTSWAGGSPKWTPIYFIGPLAYFAAYVVIVLLQYVCIRRAALGAMPMWVAGVAIPIATLFVIRYVFAWWEPLGPLVSQFSALGTAGIFLGISYMTFRVIRLAIEVRNAVVPMPTLAEFGCFVFFCPTMSIGPITTYSTFRRSLYTPDYGVTPAGESALRICKGLAKYLFLASLFSQLGYTELLLDEHQHSYIDLIVAAFAYYLFLYCNFSGFCDIVIGASGLVGLQVDENFRNPMGARNIQEFWNRWHMSLSFFMRDMVFQPMSKVFVRRLGPRRANEAMIVPVLTVFLLIGIWHGPQLNYLLFGLANGLGVLFVVFTTASMRRALGTVRYKQYLASTPIRWAAVALTFCYFSATLFFFANTVSRMGELLRTLR